MNIVSLFSLPLYTINDVYTFNFPFIFLVFIYSCPGYKCSVKERMVYSSCKSPLIYALKEDGIAIDKCVSLSKTLGPLYHHFLLPSPSLSLFQLELDDPSEVTEQFLMDELHPVKQAYRPQFAKPKPPGRKR